MGCRILSDRDEHIACLYCSTTDVAFGPVFSDSIEHYADAGERAEAFCRWLESPECPWATFEGWDTLSGRRDPRVLTDAGLQAAYATWLAQEADQQQREQQDHEQVSS